MANRYRQNENRQQGYYDYEGPRQFDQFEQRSSQQFGDDYGADYDDRSYGADRSRSFGRSRDDRTMGRSQNYDQGYGQRGSRGSGGSGGYDPLADFDRDSRRPTQNYGNTRRDRDFGSNFDNSRGYGDYSERSGYAQGSYSPYERQQQDDRGFFDRAGDEIASWFGDEDAERRREMDYRRQQNEHAQRGESHRGRGPKNYNRSDERVLEDACEHLTRDHGVDASDLEVTVKDGEITLDGQVNTRWEKRRAEDCVHDISGVKHVQNNLRIRQTEMRAGGNETASRTGKGASGTDTTSGTLS